MSFKIYTICILNSQKILKFKNDNVQVQVKVKEEDIKRTRNTYFNSLFNTTSFQFNATSHDE